MSVDHIRYDLLVREALRGVVKQVVADAARNGLPGEHHFFIAFYTRAPGVRISPALLAQHPEEMTIVLQHQFWDLAVTDTGIEVGLSFGGVPERLFVPFDAMKAFFDPSVQFGLEFEVAAERREDAAAETAEPALIAAAETPETAPEKPQEKAAKPRPQRDKTAKPPEDTTATPERASGEVVRFDQFRKKK